MRTQSLSYTWQTWSGASPRPTARLCQEEVLPVCSLTTWEAPWVPGGAAAQGEGCPISNCKGCSLCNL